jgi:hypothetical protein
LVADGSQPERPAGQILRTLAADHAGTASEQVFVLGGHQEPRVNLPAQQNRALNLIWALRERDRLRRGADPSRVMVVGAGVAGATAAAAAAREGAAVVLIERVCGDPDTFRRRQGPSPKRAACRHCAFVIRESSGLLRSQRSLKTEIAALSAASSAPERCQSGNS